MCREIRATPTDRGSPCALALQGQARQPDPRDEHYPVGPFRTRQLDGAWSVGVAHGYDGAGFQPELWPEPCRLSVPSRRRLPPPLSGLKGNGGCGHLSDGMSVTIEVDLPDALVQEARARGLFESARLRELLCEELRRDQARRDLGQMLNDLHSLPGQPRSPGEVQVEIDAARTERRARRERGH